MDKVTGNFLNQGSRDFPLDCETLAGLQTLSGLAELIGNVAGDKMILCGCDVSPDGSRRGEGYVFLRTQDCPNGEVLRFEGGAVGAGVTVKSEDVEVEMQGVRYGKAYRRRWLAAGVGEENYSWDEFDYVTGERALRNELRRLENEIRGLGRAPLGVVELWAGRGVPEGYALCDGRLLKCDDYSELWEVIGDDFNEGVNSSGIRFEVPPKGYFRLPDLRGRFIVGVHEEDRDYQKRGATGGERTHILSVEELPAHSHEVKDYYYPEMFGEGDYDKIETNRKIGSKSSDYDNAYLHYYRHDSDATGGDRSHENRPPYYALAYIMRIK